MKPSMNKVDLELQVQKGAGSLLVPRTLKATVQQ